MPTKVSDPYQALKLSHSATTQEIKQAYRTLARKYHPDRASTEDTTADFSEITSAYALLSDPQRKAEYDHIYKYGGFDEEKEEADTSHRPYPDHPKNPDNDQPGRTRSVGRSKGIGYSCNDPILSYILTQGRVRSTRTVAGLQVRRPGSMTLAFSLGQRFREDTNGRETFTTQTHQYANGRRVIRTQQTILHKDGKKEVVVIDQQADGNCTRQYFVEQQKEKPSKQQESTWYSETWQELRDKLSMCYSPCAVVEQ